MSQPGKNNLSIQTELNQINKARANPGTSGLLAFLSKNPGNPPLPASWDMPWHSAPYRHTNEMLKYNLSFCNEILQTYPRTPCTMSADALNVCLDSHDRSSTIAVSGRASCQGTPWPHRAARIPYEGNLTSKLTHGTASASYGQLAKK